MFWKKPEPFIMGIINVTPDSFYDGGKYNHLDSAKERALLMMQEGADVVDIGGESTRPRSRSVILDEECSRVLPVVEAIRKETAIPISLDTSKAELVKRALTFGSIEMVNDVTALQGDPDMANVVADAGAAILLMHKLGTPETMQRAPVYQDVIQEEIAFFEERIEYALSQGIPKENILIDPGIGFGKKLEHNIELFNRLDELLIFNCPLLVGPSRKSFIGQILGDANEDRLMGTAAAVTAAILKGAKGVRVHDVKEMKQVVQVAHEIFQSPSKAPTFNFN